MALDGAFLSLLRDEIERSVLDARIDKIYQPSKEEIILLLRGREGARRLLLSANASGARVHFTEEAVENPKSPPMFCMLLRKYLGSGRLVAVRQQGMDRVLFLDFETYNELGDRVIVTLALEIMGRHSNLIILDQDGKIIDAIKRVNEEMSSVRMILPGLAYSLPPAQDKLSLLDNEVETIVEKIRNGKDGEISKCILGVVEGVSPLLMREVAHYVTRGEHKFKSELEESQYDRLSFALLQLRHTLEEKRAVPTMVLDLEGKPKDFSFVEIRQYGHMMLTKEYDTLSSLLDGFYSERDRIERMKQRSHDLLKMIVNLNDRIARKLDLQRQELAQSQDREHLKICGDLLSANLYQLKKGMAIAKVENFYEEGSPVIEIKLDPALTPVQNSQKYYAEYRKADTAEKKLKELIQKGEEELVYVDSIFDAITRTNSESELAAIKAELASGGYIKNIRARKQKPEKLKPKRYCSSDGFTILVGRNNVQNDELTLRTAKGNDMWLHTQKIPGSHTVVLSEGREISNQALEQAAIIAAYNSRAQDSAQVPVDYTLIRNVKKPNGAKPGMVIYETYQTAYVTPDKELVESLEVKK